MVVSIESGTGRWYCSSAPSASVDEIVCRYDAEKIPVTEDDFPHWGAASIGFGLMALKLSWN
jgi:hypothetical protein